MRRLALATALATLAHMLPTVTDVAWAQDRGNPDWHYSVHPTLWLSNVDGRVVLGDTELMVGDTLLEASFAGTVEVGRGRWKGIASFYTTSVDGRSEIEGAAIPPETFADFDFGITTAEFLAAVEFGSFETRQALEFMGGLRYVRHELDVLGGPGTLIVRENWVEPMAGARYYAEMGRSFWATIDGSIGGFGIGSKISWVVGGTLGIRIAGPVDATIATRFYQTEYENSDTGYLWDEGVSQGWHLGLRISG